MAWHLYKSEKRPVSDNLIHKLQILKCQIQIKEFSKLNLGLFNTTFVSNVT